MKSAHTPSLRMRSISGLVTNEIIGAMRTRAQIPASASVRIVRRRRKSAAARGPSVREMAGSSVVTVMTVIAWLINPDTRRKLIKQAGLKPPSKEAATKAARVLAELEEQFSAAKRPPAL